MCSTIKIDHQHQNRDLITQEAGAPQASGSPPQRNMRAAHRIYEWLGFVRTLPGTKLLCFLLTL